MSFRGWHAATPEGFLGQRDRTAVTVMDVLS